MGETSRLAKFLGVQSVRSSMGDFLNVSEAARAIEAELGVVVPPRVISDLLYQRRIPQCTLVGGRRLIPVDMLPHIRDVLLDRGLTTKERPAAP